MLSYKENTKYIKKEEPPDLDKICSDFYCRLQNFFKKILKIKLENNKQPKIFHYKSLISLIIIITVIIILIIWMSSGIYIVNEGCESVVLQLGKYTCTKSAGIHWRLPYPFGSNTIVNFVKIHSIDISNNISTQNSNINDKEILTADSNLINIYFTVQYRVKISADFALNNNETEKNIAQIAEVGIRQIVGKLKINYLLSKETKQITQQLTVFIQNLLDKYRMGILITNIIIHNIQPPKEVQEAFDDIVKANYEREQFNNEAKIYAKNLILNTQKLVVRIAKAAEIYKTQVVAQAEGDANYFNAILKIYNKSPKITEINMCINTLRKIFEKSPKLLINNYKLPILSFDKIFGFPTIDTNLKQQKYKDILQTYNFEDKLPTVVQQLPSKNINDSSISNNKKNNNSCYKNNKNNNMHEHDVLRCRDYINNQ